MPIIFSTIPASRPDATRVFFQAPDDALLASVVAEVASILGRHQAYRFHEPDEVPEGVTPVVLDMGSDAQPTPRHGAEALGRLMCEQRQSRLGVYPDGNPNAAHVASPTPQSLSAAPESFLKSVIALCSNRGYSPANIEGWDKDDKWIADLWRQAESMLAASPTPPAEQQAPKETLGGVNGWRDISTAPKDGSRFVATGHNYGLYSEDRHACVAHWFRGCWMEASDWNETSELKYLTHWMPLPSPPDDVAAPAEQQAQREAKAAPQQEEQEQGEMPAFIERMAAERYKVVPSHESMFHRWAVVAGSGTQQLYVGQELVCHNMARKFAGAFLDGAFVAMQHATPQPAPAPLSDDVVRDAARYRWLRDTSNADDPSHMIALHIREEQNDASLSGIDAAIDAALAAQGGNK